MLPWYVVHSKPRKEAWLFDQFTAQQITTYYPCYREPGNSHVHKPRPYFPGYLFISVDIAATGLSAVQWVPGSIGLVTFGDEPATVPDQFIQKLRHHLDELKQTRVEGLASLSPGDQVEIQSGPFAGYAGIFDSYLSGHERVRIFLRFVQSQQMHIDLPVEQIVLKQ